MLSTKVETILVEPNNGLCGCGCGQKTRLAPQTCKQLGWIKGQPLRFIHGHHRRKKNRWTVNPRTGCWEWNLRTVRGYAQEQIGWKMVYVHRRLYEEKYGPIPDGLELDHLCRNRGCVNPNHLEAVTHTENLRRGEGTKLIEEQSEAIRRADGTQREIAKEFGISQPHVSRIRNNLRWRYGNKAESQVPSLRV